MKRVKLLRGQLPTAGPAEIDVTVKSAAIPYRDLAPTWGLVIDSKRGDIIPYEYEQEYHALLRKRDLRGVTTRLYETGISCGGSLLLCCYCMPTSWCHVCALIDYLVADWPELFEDGRLV